MSRYNKITFTEEQLILIKDISKSSRSVAKELNVSQSSIATERVKLGIRKVVKQNRKPKEQGETIQQHKYLTRQADLASIGSNLMTEEEKLKNGYTWKTIIGKYGIKETKLIKQ